MRIYIGGIHAPHDFVSLALPPDVVQNLTATLEPMEPSVTLTWNPPSNVTAADIRNGGVTSYEIHFTIGNFSKTFTVSKSVTTFRITRDMGLIPLTKCKFEVLALNQRFQGRESAVELFIGTYMCQIPMFHDVCMHVVTLL